MEQSDFRPMAILQNIIKHGRKYAQFTSLCLPFGAINQDKHMLAISAMDYFRIKTRMVQCYPILCTTAPGANGLYSVFSIIIAGSSLRRICMSQNWSSSKWVISIMPIHYFDYTGDKGGK